MKNRPISQKIIWGMAVSFFLMIVITGSYFGLSIYTTLKTQYESKGTALGQSVSDTAINAILENDPAALQTTIDSLLKIDGLAYVIIQDPKGQIICHTFMPSIPPQISKFLTKKHHLNQTITVSKTQYWNVYTPILDGEIGAVTIGMDLSKVKKNALITIFKESVILVIISFATLFMMISLIRRLTRPLQLITQSAVSLSTHDFKTPFNHSAEFVALKNHTQPEIKTLANAFIKMESELVQNINALETSLITQERYQSQLNIAADIQDSLLPQDHHASYDAATVSHFIQPAKEVGGDFVDHFVLHHRYLITTIGDVSGKGISAALIMATVLTMIRSTAQTISSPAEILTIVNQEFSKRNKNDMFITAFLSSLDLHTGELRYANAGHNHPYRDMGTNEWTPFGTELDLVLGIDEACFYKEHTLQLTPNESVLMYTDGITEAMNKEGTLFGDAQLLHTLQTSPNDAIISSITAAVSNFSGNEPQSDDQTLLHLQFTGSPTEFHDNELSFYFENNLDSIAKLAMVIEKFGSANQLSKSTVMNLNLILEELIANTIYYGYNDHDTHYIYMSVVYENNQLTAIISDDGKPFNPLEAPEVDTEMILEDRPIGGLGIHFVKNLAKELHYTRKEETNEITVILEETHA